jgi:hypothetical protein
MPAYCQAGILIFKPFVRMSDKMYDHRRMAHFMTKARLCFFKQMLNL